MCQLGKAVKEVVISQFSPVTCYRWFVVETTYDHNGNRVPMNGVIRPLNGSFGNPWLGDGLGGNVAQADMLPRMQREEVDHFTGVKTVLSRANTNGLYAYKSKQEALNDGSSRDYILAKIRIWGNCVEHEDGYRAEFAQILALFPTPNMQKLKVSHKTVKVKRVFRKKANITKDRVVVLKQEKLVNAKRKVTKRLPFEPLFRKDCPKLDHVQVIPCTNQQLSI